jgi:hypothetical protein
MPIEAIYEPSHMQLILGIKSNSSDPETRITDVVDQLDEALDIVRARMTDESIYFMALDIARGYKPGEEFMPWGVERIANWGQIAIRPQHHNRMKRWFERLEMLLNDAANSKSSSSYIWEHELVQIGEAAAYAFALADLSFVTFYTRLLALWDMDHEVMQFEAIDNILTIHGICAETEGLLRVRASKAIGQRGHDQFIELMPVLEKHYGDFKKTEFHKLLGWD